MKKYIATIFSLLFVLGVCARQGTDLNSPPEFVTIIVHNAPYLPDTIKVAPRMSYITNGLQFSIWDNYHKAIYKPHLNVVDTFSIPVKGNSIMLLHEYGYYHTAQMIAQPGDAVHIHYQKEIPVFAIVNKPDKKYDGNIHFLLDSIIYNNQQFTNLDIFKRYNFLSNVFIKKGLGSTIKKWEAYGQLALIDLQKEQDVIDSLVQLDQLSRTIGEIYTDKILFQQHIIRLQLNDYTRSKAIAIIDSLWKTSVDKPYSYYIQFCEAYIDKFIIAKLPLLRSANSVMVDYRRAYDSVKHFARTLYKGIQGQLLYKYLEQIAQNYSSGDFAKYLADFKQTTGDTLLINAISNAYLLDYEQLRQLSDSVYLINANKQKSSLDAVLKANRGKVIFVDCWASWCLPCIEAMPYTKNLMKQFEAKDFMVLFLSFDKKLEDWQRSSEKNELRYYQYNYLVINSDTAAYLQKLKINSLPRYLVFNKKGQLVNAKAADAKSGLTQAEIARLLKE